MTPSASELFETIQGNKAKVRYNAFIAIMELAEEKPAEVALLWDKLVAMLDEKETDTTYIPMRIIGVLAAHGEKKFAQLFDRYAELISHPSIVIAPHVIFHMGQATKALPELEPKTTAKILNLDTLLKVKHPDLAKAYAIAAISEYFDISPRKEELVKFVETQLTSKSPKSKKAAKEFLAKFNIN